MGRDGPIEQREERQIGLARHHRHGLGQGGGGAPIDEIRQADQALALQFIQRFIATDHIGEAGGEGAGSFGLGLRLGGQSQGQGQGCRAPHQQAAQPERDQQIRRQQDQRRRQQPGAEILLGGHAVERQQARIWGRGGQRQRRQCRAQVEGAAIGAIGPRHAVPARRVAGRWYGALQRWRGKGAGPRRRGGGAAETIEAFHRRQRGLALRRAGHAGREGDHPPEHLHEKPRERQVGPFRCGGDVEEDDAALAAGFGGDQRRAVREAGPAALGEARGGLGQHLALDGNFGRHGEAGKGRSIGEGGQGLRLFPGQPAAECAFGAQWHGQQRIRPFGDA